MIFPVVVIIGQDVLAGLTNEPQIECQVVYGCNHECQIFLSLEQVVQVGFGIEHIHT